MSFKLSLLLFAVFFGNVFWSSLGYESFFTHAQDLITVEVIIVELIILMMSVCFFVLGILEAESKHQKALHK